MNHLFVNTLARAGALYSPGQKNVYTNRDKQYALLILFPFVCLFVTLDNVNQPLVKK